MKEKIVQMLVSDSRIRNYNKEPTLANAKKCITAYEEVVQFILWELDEAKQSETTSF